MANVDDSRAGSAGLGKGIGLVVVASTVFVAGVLGLLYAFGAEQWARDLFAWIEAQGTFGLVLFGIVDALAVICLIPSAVFTLGAGFLFGPVYGVLVIVAATTLGAAVAFMIARTFGARIAHRLDRYPRLRAVMTGTAEGGWRAVMLTRLVPFFPFKASNYLFGLTQVRPGAFIAGTAIGIVPWTVTNVLAGALAGDISAALSADRPRPVWEWGMYGVGIIALLILLRSIGRRAEAALERYNTDDARDGDSNAARSAS